MTDNTTADQLRLFIERIERLEEEKRGMSKDIANVFAEAKGSGFDAKAMKEVIRLRRMDKNARDTMDETTALYRDALGLG